MDRTILSWRMLLEQELKRWEKFRDTLRIDERSTFDDLMDECRQRASAADAATLPIKTEGIFLSLLFSHHRNLKELHDKVERISQLLKESNQPD